LKKLAESAHTFYEGKIQTVPKAPVIGFNWFNVWYTPGVSKVSTMIRDDVDTSFQLSNRGNFVAVVSDSTRVLGDGDCGPSGGLGVMEGKAFLMKYLGGIDAVALCIDSRNEQGEHDPDKIIQFVKMVQHSFGAVNLEDISQPNCFKVLDVLREECDIPVWHDDAQGTACVTLAGLINALKLTGKKMSDVKIVLYGAGASTPPSPASSLPMAAIRKRSLCSTPKDHSTPTVRISWSIRVFTANGNFVCRPIPIK
jgi:malate dehydrogenase (oxaloacetate-decarboxylating)